MLPRIRHNNFIGAVELFVKSSYTKTHSNNFFNNIQHAFRKKDWVSNYDSLLTLREFFRCATQCIDSLEVRKKPGGHWIIRDLMGLDLVGLASL